MKAKQNSPRAMAHTAVGAHTAATVTVLADPTPPGGASPVLPISGGWQDGEAPVTVLDPRALPTNGLNELMLYRLMRVGWFRELLPNRTAISEGTNKWGIPILNTRLDTETLVDVVLDPAANNGAGSVTIGGAEIATAAFVYDGTTPMVAALGSQGSLYLLSTVPTFTVITPSGNVIESAAELLGMYLGYQQEPPTLTALTPTAAGMSPASLPMGSLYSVFWWSAATTSPTTPSADCLDPCFALTRSSDGAALGTLSLDHDLTTMTTPHGTVQLHRVLLSYPDTSLGAGATSPPGVTVAPMVTFTAFGGVYTIPTSDPAGDELRALLYAPVRGVDGPGLTDPAVEDRSDPAGAPRQWLSSVEVDHYVHTQGAQPASYGVKNSYTSAELTALPTALLPVNLDDPLTRLDNGVRIYQFSTASGSLSGFYPASVPTSIGPDVTAVAQGYATWAGGYWIPVLAVQSAAGAITLIDLTDQRYDNFFELALAGPLTSTRPLASTNPLVYDASTTFTGTADPRTVVNPAGQLLSPSPALATQTQAPSELTVVGPLTGVAVDGAPTLVVSQGGTARVKVTSAAYGTYELPNGSSTKVFATQLEDNGTVLLFDVASGLTPAMSWMLTSLFQANHTLAQGWADAQADTMRTLSVTYSYAKGHDLAPKKTRFALALEARGYRESGTTFAFASGQNNFSNTLARQTFDEKQVNDAIVAGQQDPEILADQYALMAAETSISTQTADRVPGSELTVRTPVWDSIRSQGYTDPGVRLTAAGGAALSPADTGDALTVVNWILAEARAETEQAVGDFTRPGLGQDYHVIMDRLGSMDHARTAADEVRIINNAYELLGVSNRQMATYPATRPGGACSNSCTSLPQAYAAGIRRALDSGVGPDSPDISTDYLRAGVFDRISYENANIDADGQASMGRWVLQHSSMSLNQQLAARVAQLLSRAAMYEFPLWAKGVANASGQAKTIQDDVSSSTLLLRTLDPDLAQTVLAELYRDTAAYNTDELRIGDLTPDEISAAVDHTLELSIATFRSLLRDVGLALSTSQYWKYVVQFYVSFKDGIAATMKNILLEDTPGRITDSSSIRAAWTKAVDEQAKAAGREPSFIEKLNSMGTIGSLSSVFALIVIGIRGEEGPQTLVDKLSFALNIMLVFAVAEHYGKLYALHLWRQPGMDMIDAQRQMNDATGLNLSFREQIRLVVEFEEAGTQYATTRIAQALKDKEKKLRATPIDPDAPSTADKFFQTDGRPAIRLQPGEVQQILTRVGIRFTEAQMDAVGKQAWEYLDKPGDTSHLLLDPEELDGPESGNIKENEREEKSRTSEILGSGESSSEPKLRPLKYFDDPIFTRQIPTLSVDVPGDVNRLSGYLETAGYSSDSDEGRSMAVVILERQKEVRLRSNSQRLDSTRERTAMQEATQIFHRQRGMGFTTARLVDKAQNEGFLDRVGDARQKLTGSTVAVDPDPAKTRATLGTMEQAVLEQLERGKQQQIDAGSKWYSARNYAVFMIINQLQGLADTAISVVAIVLGVKLVAQYSQEPLGKAAGILVAASGAIFLVASVMEVIGVGFSIVISLPIAVLGILLFVIADLMWLFVRRNPHRDDDAIAAWLQPYIDEGFVIGGAAAITSMQSWHAADGADYTDYSNCDRGGHTCVPISSFGDQYMLKHVADNLCLGSGHSYDDPHGSAISAFDSSQPSAYPASKTDLRQSTCDPDDASQAFTISSDPMTPTVHIWQPHHAQPIGSDDDQECVAAYIKYVEDFDTPVFMHACSSDGTGFRWSVTSVRSDPNGDIVTLKDFDSPYCFDVNQYNIWPTGSTFARLHDCSVPAAQWQLVPLVRQSYLLKQVGGGNCAGVPGAQGGQTLTLMACRPGLDRVYTVSTVGGVADLGGPGASVLRTSNGMCVTASGLGSGDEVKAGKCNNDRNWIIERTPRGDGSIRLRPTDTLSTKACLDSANARTGVTAPMVVGRCTLSETQSWLLVPVAAQHGFPLSQGPNCGTFGDKLSSGSGVLLYMQPCDGYRDQRLYPYDADDGTVHLAYYFKAGDTAPMCLGMEGIWTPSLGGYVSAKPCDPKAADQSWTIQTEPGDQTRQVFRNATGYCLQANWPALVVQRCDSTLAQVWTVPLDTQDGSAPRVQLKQAGSGLCATVNWGVLNIPGSIGLLAPCDQEADRTFAPLPAQAGAGAAVPAVRFVAANGLCLSTTDDSVGGAVSQQNCVDRSPQGRWVAMSPDSAMSGNGQMYKNDANGLCLDSAGHVKDIYTGLVQGPCDPSSDTQWWITITD